MTVRGYSAALLADFRDPPSILTHPDTRRLIDFNQPVAVLGIALMPFIGRDDHPDQLLREFDRVLVPGSALALSQITDEHVLDHMIPQMREFAGSYTKTQQRVFLRTHHEFEQLFTNGGFPLEEPGVVWAPQWHPEIPSPAHDDFLSLDGDDHTAAYQSVVDNPAEAVFMAGLGRK